MMTKHSPNLRAEIFNHMNLFPSTNVRELLRVFGKENVDVVRQYYYRWSLECKDLLFIYNLLARKFIKKDWIIAKEEIKRLIEIKNKLGIS